jgi:hypothetical protein
MTAFRPRAGHTFWQTMSSLLIPLGGTVVAQTAAAMLLFAIPVLGPVLTAMLDIAPERIGLLIAASSCGTVWFMTVSRLSSIASDRSARCKSASWSPASPC